MINPTDHEVLEMYTALYNEFPTKGKEQLRVDIKSRHKDWHLSSKVNITNNPQNYIDPQTVASTTFDPTDAQ